MDLALKLVEKEEEEEEDDDRQCNDEVYHEEEEEDVKPDLQSLKIKIKNGSVQNVEYILSTNIPLDKKGQVKDEQNATDAEDDDDDDEEEEEEDEDNEESEDDSENDKDSGDSENSNCPSFKDNNSSGETRDNRRNTEVVYVKSEPEEQNEETLICEVDFPCYEPDINGDQLEGPKLKKKIEIDLTQVNKNHKTIEDAIVGTYENKNKNCPYFCIECNKHFAKKVNFRRHLKRHTGKYQCEVCYRLFSTEEELDKHLVLHTGSDRFRCHLCNRLYSTKSNLKKHLKEKHNIRVHRRGDGKVKPVLIQTTDYSNIAKEINEIISKNTEINISLPYLEIDKNTDAPFLCLVCNKTFRGYPNLKQHMQTHSSLSNFTCDICHKTYSRKAHLKEHYKSHTDSERYSCNICGKKFNWKHNWMSHMEVHTGIEKYICDICGKSYAMKDSLAKHMAGHSAQYTCEICNKIFNRKVNLKEHMNLHTGSKRFSCEICNKEFNWKCNWKTHMEGHSEYINYYCNVCSKNYACKSTYQRHMVLKHGYTKPLPQHLFPPRRHILASPGVSSLSVNVVEAVYNNGDQQLEESLPEK